MKRNFYDETNYIPLGLKNLYPDEFLHPTPKNWSHLGGDISLFKIFNLFQFRLPLVGFFWFVPGFVEVD
jgi:hypothetical protein